MKTSTILSDSEWHDLRSQIQELFDITLKYTELVARESDRIWDKSRPEFHKKENQSLDDALGVYQEVLNQFHEERKRAYLQTFNRVKADSFDRVSRIEKYLEKISDRIDGSFRASTAKE
ncbi:hypothetical protein Ctha_0566 [Chloroherpeton thalassium ATCC 35110]|uniref:Uncharacterized protein n=1 Tax=Chloroherpeton thalassium (strain ATCC 35110 / GB-78) TaxID=517418 RepID=B3QV83_CHLT3|nr:hypothetical protein [Chloroherpeton thalassium]ACF13037.1 hypothetical protein Ctha_0566 [Chloroherpeton thalassium ATCC 35110]